MIEPGPAPFVPAMLQPGDCILYRPSDFFDGIVALKTWTRVSHVEVYIGNHTSVASRNGEGVNCYGVRLDHIAAVLRPGAGFDREKAMRWFFYGDGKERRAVGQKYGWGTLGTFVMLNHNPIEGHMICSEFAAGFYRHGGYPLFGSEWPDYRTPPSFFLATGRLTPIWDNGKLF